MWKIFKWKKLSAKNTRGKSKKKSRKTPAKNPQILQKTKTHKKKGKMCLHFHPASGQVGEADEQDPPNPSCFNPFSNFKYGGKGGAYHQLVCRLTNLLTSLSSPMLWFNRVNDPIGLALAPKAGMAANRTGRTRTFLPRRCTSHSTHP